MGWRALDALGALKEAITGNVAHDAADSGAPVKVGTKATDYTTGTTPVTVGDRSDLYADRDGVPWVLGGHPKVERIVTSSGTALNDGVLKTVGANQRFVVTELSAFLDKASGVNLNVVFEFDAGTDVVVSRHPGIAPGSGYVEGTGSGIIAVGGDGEDLLVTCPAPTGGGTVTVAATGFIATD